jgi:hypothetical protein
MIRSLMGIGLGLATSIALASSVGAATMTFDSLEQAGSSFVNVSDPFQEDGFQVSNQNQLYYAQQSNSQYAGSAGLHERVGNGLLTLSQISGDLFDLLSIDVSILDSCPSCSSPLVTFTGFFGAGGTISQSFQPISFGFTTVAFAGFQGLSRVEWRQGTSQGNAHQVDNIVAVPSAVPIPAAFPLLLAALGGLGFASRRRKST